ncbi:MAG: glycosyltransferase family 39 protein, partial [Anaerolineaceae bacterium]|nr:glycosyltransferase family 39 protein [Anaerolineaceae bacterium]
MTDKKVIIRKKSFNQALITVFLLALILIVGGHFRFLNLNWDESYHLHPDERYLSMVLNSIRPVSNVGEYFNTQTSTLNPNNHGYTFFVYGTFPLFIIRYVGEWIGQVGYDPITLVGRQLSAFFDLLTIILVFLIGYKLVNRRVGLIAAALYACAALPIQQAHFMTVDTFTSTFGMLAVLAAVFILKRPLEVDGKRLTWHKLWPYLLFGMGLGMATASKINAVSLALLLPLVELARYLKAEKREEPLDLLKIFIPVALAGMVSFVTFRILQPYAFSGPGFFNLKINPDWWNGDRKST